MKYTVYNNITGMITGVYSINDDALVDINLAGKSYVSGEYNPKGYYIDNGQAIKIPRMPYPGHKFDYTSKQWVLDYELLEKNIRTTRNNCLLIIDKINPIWYNSLSTEQQQELAAYRQALLNVPQQPGFPAAVEWPVQPAWL